MWRNALSLPMIRSSACCWNLCHFLSIKRRLNICLKAETLLSKQSGNSQQIIDTALFLPLFTPWVFFSDVLSCRYTKCIPTGKTKSVFGNCTGRTVILTGEQGRASNRLSTILCLLWPYWPEPTWQEEINIDISCIGVSPSEGERCRILCPDRFLGMAKEPPPLALTVGCCWGWRERKEEEEGREADRAGAGGAGCWPAVHYSLLPSDGSERVSPPENPKSKVFRSKTWTSKIEKLCRWTVRCSERGSPVGNAARALQLCFPLPLSSSCTASHAVFRLLRVFPPASQISSWDGDLFIKMKYCSLNQLHSW